MKSILAALILVAFCPGLLAEDDRDAPQKGEGSPNILLILADDMGFGDLGCYGSSQIKTPHLDSLAAGGIRFTDAYAAGAVCAPSRAGLLTGRYQNRFGFEHNLSSNTNVLPKNLGIPFSETLFPQRLQQLSYRTGIIGKWHLGSSLPEHHPNARGFDFFFGMLGGNHGYWPTPERNKLLRNREMVERIRTPYLTDWFSREAEDFLSKASDKPWFLFLSYNTPHTPMQAKEEDLAAYAHITPKRRQTYCAMQKCMDDNIGKIVDRLKATNQFEKTLIVFMSDNGGSVTASSAINAPLNGMKGTLLEGGIRSPMIMHWPNGLAAGTTFTHPVIAHDLTPTFVGLAGGTVLEETVKSGRKQRKIIRDGVDLMPYITGKNDSPPHATLFWRIALRGSAVRHGQWKLLRTPHHATMLFDLESDLSEQNNLAGKHPEKVSELIGIYNEWSESLVENPHFMSGNSWSRYNRKLYDLEYELTQPTGDQTKH